MNNEGPDPEHEDSWVSHTGVLIGVSRWNGISGENEYILQSVLQTGLLDWFTE